MQSDGHVHVANRLTLFYMNLVTAICFLPGRLRCSN